MFVRLVKKLKNDQSGITGLETAIILIAFVMVASVLAYVVLTAGLYSSQKAKQAVYAGLEEVSATVELKGNVIAKMVGGYVTEMYITLGTHPGSDGIDFTDTSGGNNKVILSYTDEYHQYPVLDWTVTKLSTTDNDTMLDPYELFQLTVDLSPVSDNASSDAEKLGPYHTFTVEVKPPTGAILAIERTVPARVNQIINLY